MSASVIMGQAGSVYMLVSQQSALYHTLAVSSLLASYTVQRAAD